MYPVYPEGTYVACPLCGQKLTKITNYHIRTFHPDYTVKKFRDRFGELLSEDWKWILSPGEHVDPPNKLDEIERQVVLGSLLGKGRLFKKDLILEGSLFQLPYLGWKGRLLRRLSPTLLVRKERKRWEGRDVVEVEVQVRECKPLSELFELFIHLPDRRPILEELDLFGLAIWMQDVGVPVNDRVIFARPILADDDNGILGLLKNKFGDCFGVRGGRLFLSKVFNKGQDLLQKLLHGYIHPVTLPKLFPEILSVNETVWKQVRFCYGHYLEEYPGACARVHGHEGVLEVEVHRWVDPESGMVVDFAELSRQMEVVVSELDHQLLNLLSPALYTPTAEIIAMYVLVKLKPFIPGLRRVRVYETPTSYAEVWAKEYERAKAFLSEKAAVGEWLRKEEDCEDITVQS